MVLTWGCFLIAFPTWCTMGSWGVVAQGLGGDPRSADAQKGPGAGRATRNQGDFTGKHGDIMVTSWWNMVKHGGLTSPAKILKKNVDHDKNNVLNMFKRYIMEMDGGICLIYYWDLTISLRNSSGTDGNSSSTKSLVFLMGCIHPIYSIFLWRKIVRSQLDGMVYLIFDRNQVDGFWWVTLVICPQWDIAPTYRIFPARLQLLCNPLPKGWTIKYKTGDTEVLFIYVYICLYIYIYIHMYTYIYTYIYTWDTTNTTVIGLSNRYPNLWWWNRHCFRHEHHPKAPPHCLLVNSTCLMLKTHHRGVGQT